MNRTTRGVAVLALALVLVGCGGGPSAEEKAEFSRFAAQRQAEYPVVIAPSIPTSIREYILGGDGIRKADYIVAGAFTGATMEAAPVGTTDPTVYTLVGQFKLHQSLKGTVPSTFDVNLGTVSGSYLVDLLARGAGDVILFLTMDAATGDWVLVDGRYSLAQSDSGELSMPLVPGSKQPQYMAGVVDVADVQAMIIAGNIDPNGSLTGGLDDLGNDEVTDTQQDLIDRANDLSD